MSPSDLPKWAPSFLCIFTFSASIEDSFGAKTVEFQFDALLDQKNLGRYLILVRDTDFKFKYFIIASSNSRY